MAKNKGGRPRELKDKITCSYVLEKTDAGKVERRSAALSKREGRDVSKSECVRQAIRAARW